MVSFSTSDASYETSKIDRQTKSWKEKTLLTNQATLRSATTAHALLRKETNLVLKEEFLLVAILTKYRSIMC